MNFCKLLLVSTLVPTVFLVSCDKAAEIKTDGVIHVSSVELNIPPSHTIGITETLQLEYRILPENAQNQNFTWVNSNPSVVSIDENGLVTPLKPGESIVGIRTEDRGVRGISILTVDEGVVHVRSIEMNLPRNYSLPLSKTYQIKVTVLPYRADNRKYYWEIDDPEVLTIDQNDILRPLSVGMTQVKAISEDKQCECFSTVLVLPDAITSLSLTEQEYAFGDISDAPHKLVAVIEPDDGQTRLLSWSSSNKSVCMVDDSGLVTVVGGGSAVVTATSQDGTDLSASCSITVPGTAIKDRLYDSGDEYYRKIYEPISITVPKFDKDKNPDGTKEQIWLDRNLGASQRATSSWDPEACGSMFQMGRKADGHEKVTWELKNNKLTPTFTGLTTQQGISRADAGHSLFIYNSNFSKPSDPSTPNVYWDWVDDSSNTGWGGTQISISNSVAAYVKAAGAYDYHAPLDDPSQICNPCPQGYRVPSAEELMQLTMMVADTTDIAFNADNKFNEDLFELMYQKMYFPMAGYRQGKDGASNSAGTSPKNNTGGVILWSNTSNTGATVSKAWQYKVYYTSGKWSGKLTSIEKAAACPIRCIKD